jgi:pilus assembly protein CpaF
MINTEIQSLSLSDRFLDPTFKDRSNLRESESFIRNKINQYDHLIQDRLNEEYFGYGPLRNLITDESISEIVINQWNSIWIERNGKLENYNQHFLSITTYNHFLSRLYLEIKNEPTLNHPFVNTDWNNHRLHIVGVYENQKTETSLTLRKSSKSDWSLDRLKKLSWANESELNKLKQCIVDRKNMLVIGQTGSGKTSILKAIINEFEHNERVVILEDTPEVKPQNQASIRLLTRHDSNGIHLSDLVKQSLRMRPDRIIVGEVRSDEAKDLLMALATGHSGSAGTLHASDPHQALIRLEMLIQMGAPNWSLSAVRRLIQLSLSVIIVCGKKTSGERFLAGLYQIASLEENGFTLEPLGI